MVKKKEGYSVYMFCSHQPPYLNTRSDLKNSKKFQERGTPPHSPLPPPDGTGNGDFASPLPDKIANVHPIFIKNAKPINFFKQNAWQNTELTVIVCDSRDIPE
jgi:hypothetical protein